MRRSALAVLLIVTCQLSSINSGIAYDSALDTLPRETFVPFKKMGNVMLIQGSVNGKAVPMVFDTGAAVCLFSIPALRSLGIKIPPDLPAASIAGVGSRQQLKSWVMPVDLKIGSIERRQFPVNVTENPLGVLLLGPPFFQDYEYTINNELNIVQFKLTGKDKGAISGTVTVEHNHHKQIESRPPQQIEQPDLSHLTSKSYITVDERCRYVYTVPFVEINRAIVVQVSINGKEIPMILDTGANICMFSSSHLLALGMTPRATGRMLLATGATGTTRAPLCVFDQAQFGPIKGPLVCAVSDQGYLPRPLLGQNFLSNWQLTVDNEHSVIKFIHK